MNKFFQKNLKTAERLAEFRIVPVLVLNSVEEGLKWGGLLSSNGLAVAEITFRTKAAPEIIRALTSEFPDLYVGAGTVLNPADLKLAKDAGAAFAVAPGFNPAIVRAAAELDMAFAPGIMTPGEIEQAFALGCPFLKFFPAEAAGGVKLLKAMAQPYRHLGIKFMPTGGVSVENAAEYLAVPEIAAVGGTWLAKAAAPAEAIRNAVNLAQGERKC